MIIKNKDEIATTKLRKRVLDIVEEGIRQVLPYPLMKQALDYNLGRRVLKVGKDVYKATGRIFVVGGGKAAGAMAEALEAVIGAENICAGIVNCSTSSYKTGKIKIIKAGHPIPDAKSVIGVRQMLQLKDNYSIGENDLIICLISGGGSALMCLPAQGISLPDKQKVTDLLLRAGADISEINLVRRCLSEIKGGGFARFFASSSVIGLIISDVAENKLDTIASGPSFPCSSSFIGAYNVLEKYNLLSKTPENVVRFLKKRRRIRGREAKKARGNCRNYIIGDNKTALKAMAEYAKKIGLKPFIIKKPMSGDADVLARLRADEIIKGRYADSNIILAGGETLLKVPKRAGRGGRNQHYAGATLSAMKKYSRKWCLAAVNTDGSDYLKEAAGAIVDNSSLISAKSKKIDVGLYLKKYDSYNLMKKIGKGLIITGATGTNVGDVAVYAL